MLYRNAKGKEIIHTIDDTSGQHVVTHDDDTVQNWASERELRAFLEANGFEPVPESEDSGEKKDETPSDPADK